MVQSISRSGLPKTFAIVLSFLLALATLPLVASSASAAGPANIDVYDQCYTGDPVAAGDVCAGWTNGILNDSNSDYNEDEVTPQRLVVTFADAGTHTIDITYLTYDHNVHAYDSLATWNHTLSNADRCQGLVDPNDCVGGSASLYPIPLDTSTHHDAGVGESATTSDHQLTGQFLTAYGATITDAQYLGLGTYAPDYQTLQVTVVTTAPDTQVMLLWGGHIAATFGPRGWGERPDGTNLGAAQVPGGSYHIRITRINGAAIGNRDNQLMSGAIEPPRGTDIATNATAGPLVIGSSISDTATVSPPDAVGSVTFNLYGPDDATCSSPAIFTSTTALAGGTATSASFTPTAVGTYRWIARFTPTDPLRFDAVSGACNDANESSVIVRGQPTIVTDAEDTAQLLSSNASINDTATVSNLTPDATGIVTFTLYGPDNATCTGAPIFTSNRPLGTVTGNSASVTSDGFAPSAAGTYRWIASYSGDAKNEPVSGACNDPNESTVVLPTSPTITTDADDTAKLPNDTTITDIATLSGVTADASGTITFKLYGPDATPGTPTCTDGVGGNLVYTSSAVAVSGPGTYGPVNTTVTQAGTYFWIAFYSGDANNAAVAGVCGDPTETSEVGVATPAIITLATNAQLPGDTAISDTASLTGLTSDATGTVTFNVWGPLALNSAAVCTGNPFATRVVALPAVGTDQAVDVPSGDVTVTSSGRYFWVASYSGDANNAPVTGACGDANETSTVNPTNPTLRTTATNGTLPAGSISDSAELTGVTADATGTITFRLYGPSAAPDCSGAAIFTSATFAVSGPGTYGPATTTVADAGSYYWIASYSGDANNNSEAGACGDAGETSVVTRATPAITTTATAAAQLPAGTISDSAQLSGLSSNATGTVTFSLYGPDATPTTPTCSGTPVFISAANAITLGGGGTATATSGSFTPVAAGTYFWVAAYSGDANNDAISGACGDLGETSSVERAQPGIATSASSAALPAGTISDVATVSGLTSDATGTVSFALYGPSAAPVCTTTPIFTNSQPLGTVSSGLATVASAAFTPTLAGNYYWIAAYSGDGNNEPVSGRCGDAGETSVVAPASPVVVTDAADVAPATAAGTGVTLSDSATLTGATATATGTLTFTLYGPFTSLAAITCAGTGIAGGAVTVNGNGIYSSAAVPVTQAGLYTWIASYSGDANNNAATHACGLAAETVDYRPGLDKTSVPAPGSVVQPNSQVAYAVTVTNTGTVALSGAPVTDLLPAEMHVVAGSISDGGVITTDGRKITWTVTLQPGASKVFTYTGTVNSSAPQGVALVNTARFLSLEDTTTHTVAAGALTVVKSVTPEGAASFGDTLTYTLTVTGTGTLTQHGLRVSDYVPGFDPDRPGSGATTYVTGSAACVGLGTCSIEQPSAANGQLITWNLGDVAAGISRQVTFQVTIDTPTPAADGAVPAVDILNAGAAESSFTPRTPSNEVITPVTAVLGVKVEAQPRALPRTGTAVPLGVLFSTGGGLLLLGLLLTSGGRLRRMRAIG